MDEALGDDAWEQIHGPHHVPKKYANPFEQTRNLQPSGDQGLTPNMDNIYSMEIEANLNPVEE
jgi:hypothetical protein